MNLDDKKKRLMQPVETTAICHNNHTKYINTLWISTHRVLLFRKVVGSVPASVSEFFTNIKYFRLHYGPGVDSASNRNEYQKYLLGVKTAGE